VLDGQIQCIAWSYALYKNAGLFQPQFGSNMDIPKKMQFIN